LCNTEQRLLLIHGRYDYRRTSKVVLNSFYKNMVLTMVLFLFTFFSGYSGQSLFEDNVSRQLSLSLSRETSSSSVSPCAQIYMMYNIVLALPVVSLGVFDRDISEGALLSYPFFYVSGRMKLDLNIHTILVQTMQSIGELAYPTLTLPLPLTLTPPPSLGGS
jgi:phospholipid-transporting ATPase